MKFLSTCIIWTVNSTSFIKKALQWLYFLQIPWRANLSQQPLLSLYGYSKENIFSDSILVWFASCPVAEKKALQRVIVSAQDIINIQYTYFPLRTLRGPIAYLRPQISYRTHLTWVATFLLWCPLEGDVGLRRPTRPESWIVSNHVPLKKWTSITSRSVGILSSTIISLILSIISFCLVCNV